MIIDMINQDINRTHCRVVECIVEITQMNYQKIIECIEIKILKILSLIIIIDYSKLDMIIVLVHTVTRKIYRVKDFSIAKIQI